MPGPVSRRIAGSFWSFFPTLSYSGVSLLTFLIDRGGGIRPRLGPFDGHLSILSPSATTPNGISYLCLADAVVRAGLVAAGSGLLRKP
jgi:hypothetical protein